MSSFKFHLMITGWAEHFTDLVSNLVIWGWFYWPSSSNTGKVELQSVHSQQVQQGVLYQNSQVFYFDLLHLMGKMVLEGDWNYLLHLILSKKARHSLKGRRDQNINIESRILPWNAAWILFSTFVVLQCCQQNVGNPVQNQNVWFKCHVQTSSCACWLKELWLCPIPSCRNF